jgi:DNA ligase (NAD+)
MDNLNPLEGKKICITGVLEHGTRNQYIKFIKEEGGKYVGTVTRSTDILVTNDSDSGTVKNQAAKEFGVTVLDEEGFHQMIKMMQKLSVWKKITSQ